MASLLRGLFSSCQHGRSGTESPSVLDSEQHLCVIRENFFWGRKRRPRSAYVFGSPRMLQKDFGGASQRSGESTRLVARLWLTASTKHISWQLYARRIISFLLTPGTVYPSHLQTGGLESLSLLLRRAGHGWHRFLTLEFCKLLTSNSMRLATTIKANYLPLSRSWGKGQDVRAVLGNGEVFPLQFTALLS